jgi:hypothetical protein
MSRAPGLRCVAICLIAVAATHPPLPRRRRRTGPLLRAAAGLHAALAAAPWRGGAQYNAYHLLPRTELGWKSSVIIFELVEHTADERCRLALPQATLAALSAAAVAALGAATDSLVKLRAAAERHDGKQWTQIACMFAHIHLVQGGSYVRTALFQGGPGGGGGAPPAAALAALMELAEAALPLLVECAVDPAMSVNVLVATNEVVDALSGRGGGGRGRGGAAPGPAPLDARSALRRVLAHLLVCELQQLPPLTHAPDPRQRDGVIGSVDQRDGVVGAVGRLVLLARDEPWSPWALSRAAAALVALGAAPSEGAEEARWEHTDAVMGACAAVLHGLGVYFFPAAPPTPAAAPPAPPLGLPRQVTRALTQAAAAAMLAADAVLPEPRFKGVERVLAELPAVEAPWEEGGGPAAPADCATAAEACAALEMAVRLLAALPEVIPLLPAAVRDGNADWLGSQLCMCVTQTAIDVCRKQPDLGDPAAAAAAVDLLASTAKLLGAMPIPWDASASSTPKHGIFTLLTGSAGCLLARGRAGDARPAREAAAGGGGGGHSAAAAAILGTVALRAALAMPSDPFENEAVLLRLAIRITCDVLCHDPSLVGLVARQGGFVAIEGQVARVFGPVRPDRKELACMDNNQRRHPIAACVLGLGALAASRACASRRTPRR